MSDDIVTLDEHMQKEEGEILDPFSGGTVFSQQDLAPLVERMVVAATELRKAIDREREFYDNLGKGSIRANTNLSGSVQFTSYMFQTSPLMIVTEKPYRGDITIVNHSPTTDLHIGLHIGITVGGSDTVLVGPGASRVIRTRLALWAIASSAPVGERFDIQEEFD